MVHDKERRVVPRGMVLNQWGQAGHFPQLEIGTKQYHTPRRDGPLQTEIVTWKGYPRMNTTNDAGVSTSPARQSLEEVYEHLESGLKT